LTLILLAASSSGIHLSSDYRLTGGNQKIPDDANAKELTLRSGGMYLHACFTGLASGAGKTTLDWLTKIMSANAGLPDIDLISNEICTKATRVVRSVRLQDRMLTIILACANPPNRLRLVLISNEERFNGRRRPKLSDKLEISSLIVKRAIVRSFGWDKAIRRCDRKLLAKMLRTDTPAKQIREQITSINRRAAEDPKSKRLISETCRVTSIFPDGATASEDLKLTPGIPIACREAKSLGLYCEAF
jgi:hypothetical protein